jgi:hypothetical protein
MKKIQKSFLLFCICLAVLIGATVAWLNPGRKPFIGFISLWF